MCLDRHMPILEYTSHGIRVRRPRRAEPPSAAEPAGHVRADGRRARAPARHAAALGVQAPPRAARRGLRRVAGRGATSRLSTPARTAGRARDVARPVPPLLVGTRGRARASFGSHGSQTVEARLTQTTHSERKERQTMTTRQSYMPGPAAGAEIRKEGEKWTL